MTLKEFLETLDKDQIIKIGAEKGSAFLWCGSIEEFKTEVESFNNDFNKATELAAKDCRNHFLAYVSKFSAKSDIHTAAIKEAKKKQADAFLQECIAKSTEDIHKAFNEWLFNCSVLANMVYDAEKLVTEPIPMIDREVVKTFKASDVVEPTNTIVIIIYGWERGKYWMVEEAKNKKGDAA